MKNSKFKIFIVIVLLSVIYFITNYAVIDRKIYSANVESLYVLSLDDSEIKEINKCTKITKIFLAEATPNQISRFRNFRYLNDIYLVNSITNNLDSKKIGSFNNLKSLNAFESGIDFNELYSKTISSVSLYASNAENLDTLSKCESLRRLNIYNSMVSGDCIVEENRKYIMKDSSIFSSLGNITDLMINVDEIQDISGILEMDSLKTFCVNKDSISEEHVKLLEDKGITVTYTEN